MTKKKAIPSIHVPIMTSNGSMELAWYLYLQYLAEGGGATTVSVKVNSTETGAPGTDAEVTNVGDEVNVELDFKIPRGQQGAQGPQGDAATVSVGTTTTLPAGSQATVTNVGTASAAVFNFGIPKGDPGQTPAVDGTTIVFNSDNELQAVATVNQNTATGATNPVFDWVGTLAEYQAQNIETLHPDWLCYITDDVGGGESVYTKAQVDSLLALKVSTGHEVIEFQAPTAQNNYTWYRKYADGWVEQGGVTATMSVPASSGTYQEVILPVVMNDIYFTIQFSRKNGGNNYAQTQSTANVVTVSSFRINLWNNSSTVAAGGEMCWQVSGMAA